MGERGEVRAAVATGRNGQVVVGLEGSKVSTITHYGLQILVLERLL